MSNEKSTDALVDGVKTAVVHFGKAAFEIAAGVGSLFIGITQTVRPGSQADDNDTGPQKVPVE